MPRFKKGDIIIRLPYGYRAKILSVSKTVYWVKWLDDYRSNDGEEASCDVEVKFIDREYSPDPSYNLHKLLGVPYA